MAKKRAIPLDGGGSAGKELAGAAALAGVAAVGGKMAWDKLSGSNGGSGQAFRLRSSEAVADGVRRIARGQLDQAKAELEGASKRKLAAGVHDTRKRLKRLRACVRLARGAVGDEVYERENRAFRDTGRRLAGARDASVLIETLDAVQASAGAELPDGVIADLRTQLEGKREQALKALQDDEATVRAVATDLDIARTRTAAWTFEIDGFDALEPGLRRVYRRGRKAMKRAAAAQSAENLHEWRKRVKDLWHALQILRPASPKRMKKLARRAHRLSDLLGDDHDLAELRRYAETHPDCFRDDVSEVALLAVIDRRRRDLQRRALACGETLYARPPKRFVKKIERWWHKNAQPVAA